MSSWKKTKQMYLVKKYEHDWKKVLFLQNYFSMPYLVDNVFTG